MTIEKVYFYIISSHTWLDEYNQGLHYNAFIVNLKRFNGTCNTFDDLRNSICIPKIEDVNLSLFNLGIRTN